MTSAGKVQLFSIRSHWSDFLLWQGEAANLAEAVRKALDSGADLRGADLSQAYLHGVDLHAADLSGAKLTDTDLSGGNLCGAYLRSADLYDADLSGALLADADLSGACLRYADLEGANLSGTILSGTDLCGTNLRGVELSEHNLRRSNLSGAKSDFFAVLSAVPAEAPAVAAAIREGRVNGSVYQGECACLVGTIANALGCEYMQIPGLRPNADRPAELLFLAIRLGDTPETNPICRLVLEWIEEWQAKAGTP